MLLSTELSPKKPWPGLRAFTESDQEFFYGRERETAALVSLIQRQSVVVLYGQSGLGKTSLIQAGIFPQLNKMDFQPFRVRFDLSEDAPSLADQIKRELVKKMESSQITAPKPTAEESLWEYFHRRDVDFWGPKNRLFTPVIVLDQFEEIFTLGQTSAETAHRVSQFAAELEALLEHRPSDAMRAYLEAHPDEAQRFAIQRESVKFVVSMREDFLAYLDPWRDRMPSLLANRFRLERMKGAQALQVVERAGREIVEPDVARAIVDFVSTSQRRQSVRPLEERDVDPALLSVVCDELNRRQIELGQPTITADLLNVEREEIIRKFYERAFADIDPLVCCWVEDELLTANGYRNRAALEDAVKLGLPAAAFEQLVNRRVLHREERSGVIWLELTHDLLTDPASQSRTAREQRHQTEEAARREAEIKRKLRGTRMVAAGFAVILIGALGALGYALVMGKRARTAEGAAILAKTDALTAEKNAKTEAEHAKANFGMAVTTAGGQSLSIASWFRSELLHPTPGILKTISDYLSTLKTYTGQFGASPVIKPNYAESLALSAEILANQGQFSEGLDQAELALNSVAELEKKPDPAQVDQLRFTKAEATYAKSICLMEFGHLKAATAQFKEAIRFADQVQGSSFKPSAARVKVLSTVGLGDVDIRAFSLSDAETHFNQALSLATDAATRFNAGTKPVNAATASNCVAGCGTPDDSNPADEDWNYQAISWQIQAHRGLGETKSRTNDLSALHHFQAPAKNMAMLTTNFADNLRWQEFDAELAYLQGITQLNLGHIAEASTLLNKALSMNDVRSKRDPENLKWLFLLGQSYQGIGLLQEASGNLAQSKDSFNQVHSIALTVKQSQPTWIQASYLEAISMYHLGALAVAESTDSQTKPADVLKHRDEALKQFAASQAVFEALVKKAPENPEFSFALVTVFKDQGDLYSQVVREQISLPLSLNKIKEAQPALDSYNKGIHALERLKSVESRSWRVQDLETRLYKALGDLYSGEKNFTGAVAPYTKAVGIVSNSLNKQMLADPYKDYELLSELETSLGHAYLDSRDQTLSPTHFTSADSNIELALLRHEKDSSLLSQKARNQIEVAEMWYARHDFAQAVKALRTAVDAAIFAFQDEPSNVDLVNLISSVNKHAVSFYNATIVNPNPSAPKPSIPPSLLKSANELLDLSDPNKLLYPNGAQIVPDSNILRVTDSPNFALPPILPGSWHTLVPSEQELQIPILVAAEPSIRRENILHIRERRLNFYKDMVLYEAEVKTANGDHGVVSYIRYGDVTKVFHGQPDEILQMNKAVAPGGTSPILDTVDQATSYLRFYIADFGYTFNGRLIIIDRADDLHWQPGASQKLRDDVQKMIRPLIVHENPDHTWGAVCTVQFQNNLYYIIFRVARDGDVDLTFTVSSGGAVDLTTTTLVASGLPVDNEDYSNGTRVLFTVNAQLDKLRQVLSVDANNLDARQRLASLSFDQKRYKEAADNEGKYVEALKAQLLKPQAGEGDPRARLRNAYVSLAWYDLFYRDFDGALSASEEGLKLDPSFLPTDTNRAHALLFKGRIAEAEAVYKKHLGETETSSGKKWEQVILEDFDALEKAGVTSPEFARIRKYLEPPIR